MTDLSKLVRDLEHPTVLEIKLAEENERLRQELAEWKDNASVAASLTDDIRMEMELAILKRAERAEAADLIERLEAKLRDPEYLECCALIEAAERDAGRYRWLRDTMHNSVGGGIEVNDANLVYEKPVPGEEVRVYWYPNTPVGFNQVLAATLDAAIDAAVRK